MLHPNCKPHKTAIARMARSEHQRSLPQLGNQRCRVSLGFSFAKGPSYSIVRVYTLRGPNIYKEQIILVPGPFGLSGLRPVGLIPGLDFWCLFKNHRFLLGWLSTICLPFGCIIRLTVAGSADLLLWCQWSSSQSTCPDEI